MGSETIYLVTDTKVTPYNDESMMGAIHEAEMLRDRTGKRVSVLRGKTNICTFLGLGEWETEDNEPRGRRDK